MLFVACTVLVGASQGLAKTPDTKTLDVVLRRKLRGELDPLKTRRTRQPRAEPHSIRPRHREERIVPHLHATQHTARVRQQVLPRSRTDKEKPHPRRIRQRSGQRGQKRLPTIRRRVVVRNTDAVEHGKLQRRRLKEQGPRAGNLETGDKELDACTEALGPGTGGPRTLGLASSLYSSKNQTNLIFFSKNDSRKLYRP